MTTASHILTASLSALVLAALATACAPESDCIAPGLCDGTRSSDDEINAKDAKDGEADPAATSAPSCTVFGKPHVGLGGVALAAKADGPAGGDRARAKPYTALRSEYARVLGSQNAPSSIEVTGSTFGVPADRWYLEPIASAVFVNTAFDVAYEGCLKMTGGDGKYAATPTKATAAVACADWSRRFWSRAATPDQIDACVSVAMDTNGWVYACASVLTATGFLTF